MPCSIARAAYFMRMNIHKPCTTYLLPTLHLCCWPLNCFAPSPRSNPDKLNLRGHFVPDFSLFRTFLLGHRRDCVESCGSARF